MEEASQMATNVLDQFSELKYSLGYMTHLLGNALHHLPKCARAKRMQKSLAVALHPALREVTKDRRAALIGNRSSPRSITVRWC